MTEKCPCPDDLWDVTRPVRTVHFDREEDVLKPYRVTLKYMYLLDDYLKTRIFD